MAATSLTPTTKSEYVVGGCYRLLRKIGEGSFGVVYRAVNVTNGEEVAVKLEKKCATYPQLLNESRVYRMLNGGFCFPQLLWYGSEGEYNVLVMELLGPSLDHLFNFCSGRFTTKTIIMLADQMISRIEFFHSKKLLHRDLKPENFLIGTGRCANKLFLVDYGLAKPYIDTSTLRHISEKLGKNLTGTARYASRNAHYRETSRRDDLESIGYILLYFIRGSLPWQGLQANTKKQKYNKISHLKMTITIDELCKNFPQEFAMYLHYCRKLRFDEVPDYVYLRELFRILMRKLNHRNDYMYDWSLLKQKKATESHSQMK